jgi:hypothetical protein
MAGPLVDGREKEKGVREMRWVDSLHGGCGGAASSECLEWKGRTAMAHEEF